MRRLLTPSLILLLGGAGWSQSHQFQITLEHFAGDPSSLDIEVRLFTAGTDVEWPDSVHHITSNPGDITVSALEPGFYDVSIRADRFLRKKLSAVPFGEPGPVDAHATGATQITVFWPEYVGATGYYVYRATTPDGFDFDNPLNATPVTTPSYAGGFYYEYTDAGLSTGQTYYYVVRAVGTGGVSSLSLSADPPEASPSSDGVPWHDKQNVTAIVAAVRTLAPENGNHPMVILAPNGLIYDSDLGWPLEPSGLTSPDSNAIDTLDGTAFWVVPEAYDTQAEAGDGNIHSGPYRRVVAAPGYRKAELGLRLPNRFGISQKPKQYADATGQPLKRWAYNQEGKRVEKDWASSVDNPHIYIGLGPTPGFDKGCSSVDAGLVYKNSQDDGTYWLPFMFVKPNVTVSGDHRKYSWMAVPEPQSTKYRVRSWEAVTLTAYLPSSGRPANRLFLRVSQQSVSDTGGVVLSVPLSGVRADASNVSYRRVVSIAQLFRGPGPDGKGAHPDWDRGYVLQDPPEPSLIDTRSNSLGAEGIHTCRLWTPAGLQRDWDAARLSATDGLMWFPRVIDTHVVWFDRQDWSPPESGVMINENVKIELRRSP